MISRFLFLSISLFAFSFWLPSHSNICLQMLHNFSHYQKCLHIFRQHISRFARASLQQPAASQIYVFSFHLHVDDLIYSPRQTFLGCISNFFLSLLSSLLAYIFIILRHYYYLLAACTRTYFSIFSDFRWLRWFSYWWHFSWASLALTLMSFQLYFTHSLRYFRFLFDLMSDIAFCAYFNVHFASILFSMIITLRCSLAYAWCDFISLHFTLLSLFSNTMDFSIYCFFIARFISFWDIYFLFEQFFIFDTLLSFLSTIYTVAVLSLWKIHAHCIIVLPFYSPHVWYFSFYFDCLFLWKNFW